MLFQRFSIIWIFSLEAREADVLGAFLPIAIIASTSAFSDWGISVWIY